MKKLYYSLFFFGVFNICAFGQVAVSTHHPTAIQKTEALTSLYQLDEAQNVKMLKIQNRKQTQLQEIAKLEKENALIYLQKLKAINQGTEVSIQIMLSQEQLKRYHKLMIETRNERARKEKELQSLGLSKEAIEIELLKVN